MGKKLEHILHHSKSPSKSDNQLLEILKMKFVLIALLLTVLVSCSMAQQSWGTKHRLRSGRDLGAGAEISLNDLEERDDGGMGAGCKSHSHCNSNRDCRGQGKYIRCADRKCCTEYQ